MIAWTAELIVNKSKKATDHMKCFEDLSQVIFHFYQFGRRQLEVKVGVNDILNKEVIYLGLDKRLIEFQRYFDQFSLLKNKTKKTKQQYLQISGNKNSDIFNLFNGAGSGFLSNCIFFIFKLSLMLPFFYFDKFFKRESCSLELEAIAFHTKKYFSL